MQDKCNMPLQHVNELLACVGCRHAPAGQINVREATAATPSQIKRKTAGGEALAALAAAVTTTIATTSKATTAVTSIVPKNRKKKKNRQKQKYIVPLK